MISEKEEEILEQLKLLLKYQEILNNQIQNTVNRTLTKLDNLEIILYRRFTDIDRELKIINNKL